MGCKVHSGYFGCPLPYAKYLLFVLVFPTTSRGGDCWERGWVSVLWDLARGLISRVEDPCEAYYTAVMVDPVLEVNLLTVILETASVCLVIPAKTLGESLGAFISHLLVPLPGLWKLPVLLLLSSLLIVTLLLRSGYELKVPLVFSLRPGAWTCREAGGPRRVGGGGRKKLK